MPNGGPAVGVGGRTGDEFRLSCRDITTSSHKALHGHHEAQVMRTSSLTQALPASSCSLSPSNSREKLTKNYVFAPIELCSLMDAAVTCRLFQIEMHGRGGANDRLLGLFDSETV